MLGMSLLLSMRAWRGLDRRLALKAAVWGCVQCRGESVPANKGEECNCPLLLGLSNTLKADGGEFEDGRYPVSLGLNLAAV
jgi:hypothetical protein